MKIFSGILFSFLMLAPGLHLTVDYHICHDRIASRAVSLTSQQAPVCNGEEFPACSDEEQIMSHCCSGLSASYSAADDFIPIVLQQISQVPPQLVLTHVIPGITNSLKKEYSKVGQAPIDDSGGLTEPLTDLFCVYRI